MKKLLLSSAAIGALALVPASANAQVSLDIGGYVKGYAFYTDQDDDLAVAAGDAREFDIIRNSEVHLSGETTLDNGLTVGVHLEAETDGSTGAPGASDSFNVEENYIYFSGDWGRVNAGSEDGAAYLLQVATPSADSNIDGIRQHVNPVNYTTVQGGAVPAGAALTGLAVAGVAADGVDYDQDVTRTTDKLTYLSPVFNGFQLGLSYTPDVAGASTEDALNLDDVDGAFGESYEAAARYEGQFNNVGVIIGAGYTHVEEESPITQAAGTITDDRTAWNAGIDLDIGPFGVGVAYMEDDFGDVGASATTERDEEETLVIGVDYTTGPFKLGASYLDQDGTNNISGLTGTDGIETQRYTGGVVYTYGPGMTFRGSVSYIEHDNVAGTVLGAGNDSVDATSVTVGTQINF
ncbi:MAG: porin [Micavibrio sp.]|nr:MAG: porin [Micavibrio sp.]